MRGDPLQRRELRRLNIQSYRSAILLSDVSWLGNGLSLGAGDGNITVARELESSSSEASLLRLDALVRSFIFQPHFVGNSSVATGTNCL